LVEAAWPDFRHARRVLTGTSAFTSPSPRPPCPDSALVWGVSVGGPMAFSGVVVCLLAVATVASVTAALRILRRDPARTLRQE